MINLRAIPAIVEMTWRQVFTDAFVLFTVIIQPILVAALGLWMLKDKGSDYGIYIVVGSGMTGLWSSLLFVSGNAINMERRSGTLETLVGIPTPLSTIIFGKNVANVSQSLVSMIGAYLLISLVFGYPLKVAQPALFAVSLVFTVIAFICFGLIIAPLFVLNPAIQQWQNAFEFPVYMLSGFLFPIAMLPVWSIPISYVLPTYWAAKALHMTSSGGARLTDLIPVWLILVGSSALYMAVSGLLFRVLVRKAKRDATLDME